MTFAEQLAADAGQPTAKLTTDFLDMLDAAMHELANARIDVYRAECKVLDAKDMLDDVTREAIENGAMDKSAGANVEIREAKLAAIVKPQADLYRDAKRDAASAALTLQIASDRVRHLKMMLDAHKVGVVLVPSPGTAPDELITADLSGLGLT